MATFSDDFNRADSTDVGSVWDAQGSLTGAQIVSNKVRPASTGAINYENYNGAAIGNAQFARIAIATLTGAAEAQPTALARSSDPNDTCYGCHGTINGGTYTTRVIKRVTGAFTSLASENATTWVATDKVTCAAISDRIVGLQNGAILLNATDSAIASGRPGFGLFMAGGGSLADLEIDDFFGGDLSTATLRPAGDGTTTGWSKVGGTGTFASSIVDDPDSNDGDTSYVLSPNVTDGQMWVTLDSTPSDFDIGVAADLKASIKKVNTPQMTADTSDAYLQLQRSDETTALTTESAVCNVTVTASYTLFTRTVPVSGTQTKTNWDAARLRLRFDHTTQQTADTVNQIRITAAEVIAYYIPAVAAGPETFQIAIAAQAISVATLTRKQFVALVSTATAQVTLTPILTAVVTLAAQATSVATLAALAVVGVTLDAIALAVATLARVQTFVVNFSVMADSVTTMVRKQFVTLEATATSVAGLVKKIFVSLDATAISDATISIVSTFIKSLSATATSVADLTANFISGGGGVAAEIKSAILFVARKVFKRSSSG